MTKDIYISPEFNPRSLHRAWGFILRSNRPEILEAPTGNLASLRVGIFTSVQAQIIPAPNQPTLPKTHPKVTTDGLPDCSEQLCRDVGFDIISLALLADVPIHRPTHLTHSSLIGHWRWLRELWRCCANRAQTPQTTPATDDLNPVTNALLGGKNNLAIARLRSQFKQVEAAPEDSALYHSFLANLTLFCPFTGTELLWRQGLVERDLVNESRTEGTTE